MQQQQQQQHQHQVTPAAMSATLTPTLSDSFSIHNDQLIDPVIKCQELFSQLKSTLQSLLAHLSAVLNPQSSESNPATQKVNSDNQFQLLGKCVENLNRVCDLMVVNLRVAFEAQTISQELKNVYRYYAHVGAMDANRQEVPFINSVNVQTQRINDFRALITHFLSISNGAAISLPSSLPPSTTATQNRPV